MSYTNFRIPFTRVHNIRYDFFHRLILSNENKCLGGGIDETAENKHGFQNRYRRECP